MSERQRYSFGMFKTLERDKIVLYDTVKQKKKKEKEKENMNE